MVSARKSIHVAVLLMVMLVIFCSMKQGCMGQVPRALALLPPPSEYSTFKGGLAVNMLCNYAFEAAREFPEKSSICFDLWVDYSHESGGGLPNGKMKYQFIGQMTVDNLEYIRSYKDLQSFKSVSSNRWEFTKKLKSIDRAKQLYGPWPMLPDPH
ncbi:MAG: hypothetical protein DWQ01_10880 [Planctomycetota bacterium]|nr:MAG: hypothetical protein DWQ01_10880 [Planctomycetota bacterium]